jgi:thymidylate kinase
MAEIVFIEGPDYSGKSTGIKIIAKALEKKGKKVLITKEPGGTPANKYIRSLLLDADIDKIDSIDYLARRMLYAADHVHQLAWLDKHCSEYDYILVDRYHPLSDFIYGQMMQPEGYTFKEQESKQKKAIYSRDLNKMTQDYIKHFVNETLLLDAKLIILQLNEDKLLERIELRNAEGNKPDVFDVKGLDFKKKIVSNYNKIINEIKQYGIEGLYPNLRTILPFKFIEIINANTPQSIVGQTLLEVLDIE